MHPFQPELRPRTLLSILGVLIFINTFNVFANTESLSVSHPGNLLESAVEIYPGKIINVGQERHDFLSKEELVFPDEDHSYEFPLFENLLVSFLATTFSPLIHHCLTSSVSSQAPPFFS